MLAVARDLQYRDQDFRFKVPAGSPACFAIIKSLIAAGASRPANSAQAVAALDKAEQDLITARKDALYGESDGVWQAELSIVSTILTQGGSMRGYRRCGECRMEQGDYGRARQCFRTALLWDPADSRTRDLLAIAGLYSDARDAIRQLLPAGSKVFRLIPFVIHQSTDTFAAAYITPAAKLGVEICAYAGGKAVRVTGVETHAHAGVGGDPDAEVQLKTVDLGSNGENCPRSAQHLLWGGLGTLAHGRVCVETR